MKAALFAKSLMNRAAGILAGCNNDELRRGVCTRVPKFHGEEGSVELSTRRVESSRSSDLFSFGRAASNERSIPAGCHCHKLTVAMAPEESLWFEQSTPGLFGLTSFRK